VEKEKRKHPTKVEKMEKEKRNMLSKLHASRRKRKKKNTCYHIRRNKSNLPQENKSTHRKSTSVKFHFRMSTSVIAKN